MDQLNFPVEINNYLKHRYDYQQYINEMNNYLYEKTKKTLFLFLTKNGNFDEENFNYGKKFLFQDPSNKLKHFTKLKNIYDISPYILLNNTKYVVHKFKEVFNLCHSFIERLRNQNFFIEMYKRNYIHTFINSTNEGYEFFNKMNAYLFNNEKILKQIQMMLEIKDIGNMKKIDLLIWVDLNKILMKMKIYFQLPTSKIPEIKLSPKLILCSSDYCKQFIFNVDRYFNFNNLEKDKQITYIKIFADEFKKDILENKKDFTNKLYFVRFFIVFLFHNLKIVDLKKKYNYKNGYNG